MQNLRKHILFFSIIAMMASLFVSRVALSVSIAVFIVTCFFHKDITQHTRKFFSSPVLWSMSLLFILPLVSGLWSADKSEWMNIVRIKLPLLLLPPAFAAPFYFSKKNWQSLALIFILIITAGTVWSMFHYTSNMAAAHEGYLHARTIMTPLENDHVRFSLLVAIAVLIGAALCWQNKDRKNIAWILAFITLWLIFFLHILAARTGLFSFYIMVFATVLRLIFKNAKPLPGITLLILVVALPVIAYFALPTFRNRVKYFIYDFEYFKDAHYLPGGNDASRVISLKAGWNIMKQNPVKGTGFGDILAETKRWYQNGYPQMQERDQILPSSEWLIYGAACGIMGLGIFTFVMLVPFFVRMRNKWPWWLLNGIVAFAFLFDIGLEVQFGVFIYSFIVLAGWKWCSGEA